MPRSNHRFREYIVNADIGAVGIRSFQCHESAELAGDDRGGCRHTKEGSTVHRFYGSGEKLSFQVTKCNPRLRSQKVPA